MNAKLNTAISAKAKSKLDSLADSRFPEDWYIVAYSVLSSEEQLKKVAKKCAGYRRDTFWSTRIAEAICQNPNSTNNVITVLADTVDYQVFYVILDKWKNLDEQMLVMLAHACEHIRDPAGIEDSMYVARCVKKVCDNTNSSYSVGSAFVDSAYTNVWYVILQYPYIMNLDICTKLANRIVEKTASGKYDFWSHRVVLFLAGTSYYWNENISKILAASKSEDIREFVEAIAR